MAVEKAAGNKGAANKSEEQKKSKVIPKKSADDKTKAEITKESNGKPRIGVFVCHCGSNIAGFLDVPDVTEYAKSFPSVVYATRNLHACSEAGISAIEDAIRERKLNRVVVASCTPRAHESLFRTARESAGLNKHLFEFADIRDQCSWVHMNDWDKATAKAKDLVRMSVMKAALLRPLEEIPTDVHPARLVIGAGIDGMNSALSIADQGFEVFLIEKEAEVGGMMRNLHTLTPTDSKPDKMISRHLKRITSNKNIHLYTGASIKSIDGYFGNFNVTVSIGDREESFKVGTIVVATGADELKPEGLYGYGELENVMTQTQLELKLNENKLPKIDDVVFIQRAGSRGQWVSYCSRTCCMVGIKNAIALKENNRTPTSVFSATA